MLRPAVKRAGWWLAQVDPVKNGKLNLSSIFFNDQYGDGFVAPVVPAYLPLLLVKRFTPVQQVHDQFLRGVTKNVHGNARVFSRSPVEHGPHQARGIVVQRIHHGHGNQPQMLQIAGVLLPSVQSLVMLQGLLNLNVAWQREALADPYALCRFFLGGVEIVLPFRGNDAGRLGCDFKANLLQFSVVAWR